MTDVALVPKGHIFQRHSCISANDPRQTAQPLVRDRVALVWHCRAAFLPFPKKFFQFENFSPLKMTKLSRPTVYARSDQRERGTEFGVPIPLHDLCGKRGRL